MHLYFDISVPVKFFSVSSLVNLIVFISLIPVVIYASARPFLCHGYANFLEIYQSLPTVSVLPSPDGQWDDLSLYLLFLNENISELKSFKYIKVCWSTTLSASFFLPNIVNIDLWFGV